MKLLIALLTAATGILHLLVGFDVVSGTGGINWMLVANGAGYLVLLALYLTSSGSRRSTIRWILLAYTLITLVGYFVINGFDLNATIPLVIKAIELLLIILLVLDRGSDRVVAPTPVTSASRMGAGYGTTTGSTLSGMAAGTAAGASGTVAGAAVGAAAVASTLDDRAAMTVDETVDASRGVVADVTDATGDAWDATTDMAGDAADYVGDKVEDVTDATGDAWDATTDMAGDAADYVGDKVEDVADATGDAWDATTDMDGDAADYVGDKVEDVADATGDAWDDTTDMAGDAADYVGDKVEDVADATGEMGESVGDSAGAAGAGIGAAMGSVDDSTRLGGELDEVVEGAEPSLDDLRAELEDYLLSFGPTSEFRKPVEYIEGIGEAYGQKLRGIGIESVLDLIVNGATRTGRKHISDQSGVAQSLILTWVNHVDLFRIKGIAQQYAELLEQSGVDTVMELAQRNPANLHKRMNDLNEQKALVRRTPHLSEVQDWVQQAKGLRRLIHY